MGLTVQFTHLEDAHELSVPGCASGWRQVKGSDTIGQLDPQTFYPPLPWHRCTGQSTTVQGAVWVLSGLGKWEREAGWLPGDGRFYLYWVIMDIQHISFKCTTQWFSICIYNSPWLFMVLFSSFSYPQLLNWGSKILIGNSSQASK